MRSKRITFMRGLALAVKVRRGRRRWLFYASADDGRVSRQASHDQCPGRQGKPGEHAENQRRVVLKIAVDRSVDYRRRRLGLVGARHKQRCYLVIGVNQGWVQVLADDTGDVGAVLRW